MQKSRGSAARCYPCFLLPCGRGKGKTAGRPQLHQRRKPAILESSTSTERERGGCNGIYGKPDAPLLAFFSAAGFFAADFFVVFAAGFFAAGLGGGTELAAAFEPLTRFSQNERPASVVVFTDGRGDFPPESAAQGIPVLWLFTEQGVQAPWGKAAWLGGGNGNEQK